jgi:hypothetical protein
VRGADDRVRRGETGRVQHPGDAEVGQAGVELAVRTVQQDVVGLEVAVDDAQLVRLGQRGRHLGREPGRLARLDRVVFPQVLAQAAARHQVHDQAQRLADAEQVANPHHVAVPQHQQDRALLHEAGDQLGLPQQALVQQFHRNRLPRGPVDPAPDRARGTLADGPHEEVRTTDAPPAQIERRRAVGIRARAAARGILIHLWSCPSAAAVLPLIEKPTFAEPSGMMVFVRINGQAGVPEFAADVVVGHRPSPLRPLVVPAD